MKTIGWLSVGMGLFYLATTALGSQPVALGMTSSGLLLCGGCVLIRLGEDTEGE